jgi:hypothetical protein
LFRAAREDQNILGIGLTGLTGKLGSDVLGKLRVVGASHVQVVFMGETLIA